MSYGYSQDLIRDLRRYLGETVTIYTTSGGDSGSGFTGVLIDVNCNFVRLLSDIGPAPGCALGSCCDRKHGRNHCDDEDDLGEDFEENTRGRNRNRNRNRNRDNRIDCNLRNTGAVVDIPVDRIAAFVHNAI